MAQNPKVPGTGNLLNQFPLNIEETNLNRSAFVRVTSQKEAAPEQKRSLNTHSKNCLAAMYNMHDSTQWVTKSCCWI